MAKSREAELNDITVKRKMAQMTDSERQTLTFILDETRELRQIIGNQHYGDTCRVNLPMLKAAYDLLDYDSSFQARYFFLCGFMQGKHAERQRRKKEKSV